jgi:hypothetical protein
MTSPAAEVPWRVYVREWMIVYTSDSSGPEGADECWDHFERLYKGRVRKMDRQVITDSPHVHPYLLKLRLPNLKGEFRDQADARVLVSDLVDAGCSSYMVQRGSEDEKVLLDYGRKMLPDGDASTD